MDTYKKWTFASIAPICMKEQRENCENYGDVSLFNSGYKMYARINNISEYISD
jgi:hypothetical protein